MSKKASQLRIEERRKTVAANLLSGLNYRDIADALGVSVGTIANDVKVIVGRLHRETMTDIAQVVDLELRRLDRALNGIWQKVLNGDLAAIDRFLRISERRAKLLGLEVQKVEMTKSIKEMTDDELTEFIASIGGAAGLTPTTGSGSGEGTPGEEAGED